MEAKISLIFSRPMGIRKPEIPKTFEDAYLSVFASPDAPEYLWSPYPCDRQPQQSLYRQAISLECQLAVIIEEASRFFTPAETGTPVSNYNDVRIVKEKLQRWGAGPLQRFLTRNILLPSILFLEITYGMVFLKLLHRPCRFPLQDDVHESPAFTRASYGASIISNLWLYQATYGMRHEYWLAQSCLAATTAVIFKLDDNSSLSKSVVMACQLLYSIGEFLPVANEYLLAIKEFARQQTVDLPQACRITFSGLSVRTGE
ncbi:nitrogen assimilation transcription factor nira [Fusarium oxysporum f. sp. phaseoli]